MFNFVKYDLLTKVNVWENLSIIISNLLFEVLEEDSKEQIHQEKIADYHENDEKYIWHDSISFYSHVIVHHPHPILTD